MFSRPKQQGSSSAAAEPAAAAARQVPRKKNCTRCSEAPWSKDEPFGECIAATNAQVKRAMKRGQLKFDDSCNRWECSACVSAAAVIQEAVAAAIGTGPTAEAAAGQQQLHTAAAAAAPAAGGGKRRAQAHTLMGTGEAHVEVKSLRAQLKAATRKIETLERAAVQLKLKATELKRVQKEIAGGGPGAAADLHLVRP